MTAAKDSHLPSFFHFLAGALLILTITSCNAGTHSIDYYVATDGNDQYSGGAKQPFRTIARAMEAVRAHEDRGVSPINVIIREGVYRLDEALTFTREDSGGMGAEVTYKAAAGEEVILSGAIPVTGWTLHNPQLDIWSAPADTSGVMPRQLYVNGRRAVRARTPEYPNYYTPTGTGYTYDYDAGLDEQIPPIWENPSIVEAVTVTQWKMMRCPVDRVEDSEVFMQNNCWKNANVFPYPWNFHLLSWWENAYEFLDEPGEWFLNTQEKTLYYIPLADEYMLSTEMDVELPVLETLLVATGDAAEPVQHLCFENLQFMYATWLGPNSSDGYALDQSGFHLKGPGHKNNDIGHDPDAVGIPGNVEMQYAQHITFEDNTFARLGAVALHFGTGSQNNNIVNNHFYNVSAAAIQLGGIAEQDHHPSQPSQLTSDNRIANNLIEYAGQEFYDAPGVYIGFTARTLIEHNEIKHVPWSGIAIGWGWGLLDPGGFAGLPHATPYLWGIFESPSAMQDNKILHNSIEHYLEKLWDGGAIYSTGFQGTSMENGLLLAWNVARNKRPLSGSNTFYTDGGSRYVTVRQNVSLDNPPGVVDFGPCLTASSFSPGDLCLATNIIPYGADMGGCVPYGDILFENNYLADPIIFYDICKNEHFPDAPVNLVIQDNVLTASSADAPADILTSAGRQ